MLYLGIDPGRGKTGLALVSGSGEIIRLCVAETNDIVKEIGSFLEGGNLIAAVIGDGTNSAAVKDAVKDIIPVPVETVGEAHSTEEARAIYWEENPPRGIKRIIPLGLLTTPVPLDAYAAAVLVRRYLKEKKNG
ncbi:MAG: pre-16S rRNA-processing nuclease YqgF [Phascolarctobacterium sp.]|nr:pre-16S rRNA-processing nuclease YqgF [Phascolarctobacterium sp.]